MISKRLLGFLIPAFIASLIYGYLQMPKQERITGGNDKGTQGSAAQKKEQTLKSAKTADSNPVLRSDLLDRKPQPYLGVRHDLFFSTLTAEQKEEVTDIPAEEPPEEVVVQPVVIPPPPPPPPPSPQEVVRKELSQYKFVGFYKKGEKQTIFLSSSGEIFLVRKGDYLGRDRRYFVLNITDTTLELRKEGAGVFSIKLNDQESLSAVTLRGEKQLERAPVSPPRPVQEMGLPEQPEFLTVPDEETQDEEPIQPEEDNDETQN